MPEYLTFAAAGATLPRPVSEDTIRRWVRVGLKGERLNVIKMGGQSVLTPELLADFFSRLSRPTNPMESHDLR